MVKNPSTDGGDQGQDDPLEKCVSTHSWITIVRGVLWATVHGLQRAGLDWSDLACISKQNEWKPNNMG